LTSAEREGSAFPAAKKSPGADCCQRLRKRKNQD
jgi:hypothetical protein